MNPLITLGAAIIGYLLGSISFARIVTRLAAPDLDIGEGVDLTIPGTDETTHMDAIAGTAVAAQLGDRYGCATAIGDILKVFVPTIALFLGFRDQPYYLVAAALGVVGHNWPLYFAFKGGAGLSPITGGFLVVAPLGIIVTSVVSTILGFLVIKGPFGIFLGYSGWILLMIPWVWFRTGDPARLIYAVVVNVLYIIATVPSMKMMIERQRSGAPDLDFESLLQTIPHGRHILRLQGKLRRRSEETSG